jgi:hypothetical protein
MDQKALFADVDAMAGRDAEVAAFLRGARGAVAGEPDTRDWYALRFGPQQFAIFDTFADNAGRFRHLLGPVGRSMLVKAFTVLDGLPDIRPADIVAAKRPSPGAPPRYALHVPLIARPGMEDAVANVLATARRFAETEPDTASWYAMRLSGAAFAFVGFFPTASACNAHLTGAVADALLQRAGELLVTAPAMRRGEVLASKIAARPVAAGLLRRAVG